MRDAVSAVFNEGKLHRDENVELRISPRGKMGRLMLPSEGENERRLLLEILNKDLTFDASDRIQFEDLGRKDRSKGALLFAEDRRIFGACFAVPRCFRVREYLPKLAAVGGSSTKALNSGYRFQGSSVCASYPAPRRQESETQGERR